MHTSKLVYCWKALVILEQKNCATIKGHLNWGGTHHILHVLEQNWILKLHMYM